MVLVWVGWVRWTVVAYAVLLCCVTFGTAQAGAQEGSRGSRHLATDHWSYEHIRRLRTRGYLANLNPLVQPYRRMNVARGLAALDPDTLGEPVAGWIRLLSDEFRSELDRLAGRASRKWGGLVAAGARGSTSKRIDVLRPLGDAGAWPRYNLGAWFEAGPLSAELRLLGDTHFNDDPDGLDPGVRSDNAYVAADFSVGRISAGRFKRNWSVLGTEGLMISGHATSYPQVGIEVGVGRFTLRAFTGELDTLGPQKRYIAAHRLDYATEGLVVSFGEAILYGLAGGGPQLRFLNPVEFLFFDQGNAPDDAIHNLMLDGQIWLRRGGLVFHAEGLLDDIDVIPQGPDPEPSLFALSVGTRVSSIAPWLELSLQYQLVSAWAYRTPDVVDRYSFLERGLGDNYSDYDRLTLSADIYPGPMGLRITPALELQRQGEGDFRDSILPFLEYLNSPTLFLGVRETTYRIGLSGRYQPNRFFWITWDVGENFIRNARHIAGRNVAEFSAAAGVGARIDFPVAGRR